MARSTVFMFSGQGTHYFQMGRELFDAHPVFNSQMKEMDLVASRLAGSSLLDALYWQERRKVEPFDDLMLTSIGIFMIEYALARTLMQEGIIPDLLLSTSLGTFTAAAVGCALSRDDGLAATVKMASEVRQHCRRGAMFAVLDEGRPHETAIAARGGEIAAYNLADHFVVAADEGDVDKLTALLAELDLTHTQLAVTYPFHSRWVDPVRDPFRRALSTLTYHPLKIPVICCASAERLSAIGPEELWGAIRRPIHFAEAVRRLETEGAHRYVDVGPSGSLAAYVKRGVDETSSSEAIRILNPFGTGLKSYQATVSTWAPAGDGSVVAASSDTRQRAGRSRLSAGDEVFIYPGQGSQFKGMGEDVFDRVPEFRDREAEIDGLLGYSVRRLCLDDPQGVLSQTAYTQPALYIVNALHGYLALAEGRRPATFAGHSLGEYNALHSAGVFDFMTGLRLVQKRGALMAQAHNGAMAAVMGLGRSALEAALREAGLSALDIASHNSPSQLVLSGSEADIDRALPLLEAAGAAFTMRLPVSAAFHSRAMTSAARQFEAFLSSCDLGRPALPVVSNVTAEYYSDGDVRPLLVRQITSPVRWVDSIEFLMRQGARNFSEMGPGVVLTKLVRDIVAASDLEAA